MKLTVAGVASTLLSLSLASLSTAQCNHQATWSGNITAPRFDIRAPPNFYFNFTYSPTAWCDNPYSGVSAWLTRTPYVYVNPSGALETVHDNLGVLQHFGEWRQPKYPAQNPPQSNAPPRNLLMPDFTSLGIVPGALYFSVVETAWNCSGSPTYAQYGVKTVRLINAPY